MTANATEHTNKLLTDLKRVVRDSEELLQDSAGAVGEKAQEIRERLSHRLELARAACCRCQEKTKAAAQATDKIIRDHPYQSIGIGFGVGVLVGLLITRER